MNVAQILRRWQMVFHRNTGEIPKFMPMSAEELDIIRFPPDPEQVGYYTGPIERSPVLFGVDVFESPFGPEMRTRQVKMPLEQLCISDKTSIGLNPTIDTHRDLQLNILYRRLSAHVCKDTTKVSVTFEFDPWATFKRKLRLTRWFPVKKRTIEIDGRVLYPYLNITFPLNRHHVTFAVRPS